MAFGNGGWLRMAMLSSSAQHESSRRAFFDAVRVACRRLLQLHLKVAEGCLRLPVQEPTGFPPTGAAAK